MASQQLRRDALQIWHAGVNAVRSDALVRGAVHVEGQALRIGGDTLDLQSIGRIAVVGAGKAGAGMAAGLEEALGLELLKQKHVQGWVNVPADCVRPLSCIHLHPARPAGVNEPTAEAAAGAAAILRLVDSLGPDDLCLALISGGGSALMPAPRSGISLADKLAVTRFLSAAGANIEELNTVRKQLSQIKGGGLARACRAGRLWVLIISDVLGDRLDVIASGPTVPDRSTNSDALAVLERYAARQAGLPQSVFELLSRPDEHAAASEPACQVAHFVIGNNAVAVDAAGRQAERLGYRTTTTAASKSERAAEEVGRQLARSALQMREESGRHCLVSGGEPVVKLIDAAQRGKGGRNQQLVLAATAELVADGAQGVVLLSGGTDGEDGPTDAAGAVVDSDLIARVNQSRLDPADFLRRNDAYDFFAPLDGLIETGPTHTNVCDLRVVLTDRSGA